MTPPATSGPAGQDDSARSASLLWFCLPALVAVASRATSLACGFAMDDFYNIVDNPDVRSLGAAWVSATRSLDRAGVDAWTQGLNQSFWRPAATLSWAVDAALWGLWPAAFHAGNVLLHAVNATLVGLLLRRLGLGLVPAALAAAWWAGHAVHSETVTLVTYRTELLAGACTLLALVHAAGRRDDGHPLVLALLLAVGLSAKESAASLPLLWLALVGTRRRLALAAEGAGSAVVAPGSTAAWLRRRAPALAAMAAVGAGWLAIRAALVQPTGLPFFGALTPWQTLLSALAIQVKQASWLLLPWPLAPFWDQTMVPPVLALPDLQAVAGGAWLGLLAVVAVAGGRRRPHLALAAAIWLLALVPTAQIVPLPVGAAERFVYIASVGAALALALAVQALQAGPANAPADVGRRCIAVTAICAWILGLSALSAVRSLDFRDDDTLSAATVRDHPDGFAGWHLLGKRALARGDAATACTALERAATILPGFEPNERLRALAWQAAARGPGPVARPPSHR